MNVTLERELTNPKTKLEKEIAGFGTWFHNLHLPDGTQTAPDHPLGDFPRFKWKEIGSHIPVDLSGWKVLDIGCNAGFYSFEMAKRGADVIGIDSDPHYLEQASWAAKKFNLQHKVTFRQMRVYELMKFKRKEFDLVLFMGVFYHLRYPLFALDIISNLFSRFMIFQTLTLPGDDVLPAPGDMKIDDRYMMVERGWPKMAFIENALEGDYTNWWAPNHSCIEAMIRSCGMEIFNHPAHEIYFCSNKVGFNKMMIEEELHTLTNSFFQSNGRSDD